MAWTFEQIGSPFDDTLDGPVWDGEGLLFCRVLNNEILRWDAATGDISVFRRFTARTSALAFGVARRAAGGKPARDGGRNRGADPIS